MIKNEWISHRNSIFGIIHSYDFILNGIQNFDAKSIGHDFWLLKKFDILDIWNPYA